MRRRTLIVLTILVGLAWTGSAFAALSWRGIVVHHSESPCWTTVADIDRWHRERGFDEIGYNFVITCDGVIHPGRALTKVGAHAKGRNADHIGICLIGTDNFTPSQHAALHTLLEQLTAQYTIRTIERHHDRCPGRGINDGDLST